MKKLNITLSLHSFLIKHKKSHRLTKTCSSYNYSLKQTKTNFMNLFKTSIDILINY